MRAVVQLVKSADVRVDGKIEGQIGVGLLVFLGVDKDDRQEDLIYMVDKIASLRIFEDEHQKMNLSIKQVGGAVLVVSQFTLLGDCRKGKRPSFTQAADHHTANEYYEKFVKLLKDKDIVVEMGIFRAYMEVHLINDGPVTMMLDSRKYF